MIRHQQDRSISRSGLDVLEAVNSHDVVGGKMNQPRPQSTLAPGPESFPGTEVHLRYQSKRKALKPRQNFDFFWKGNALLPAGTEGLIATDQVLRLSGTRCKRLGPALVHR